MSDAPELTTRDPDDSLDAVLRHELRWDVPPELTARLISLVPGAPMLVVAPPRLRPKPWYSMLVLVLTAVALGLSLAIAWQLFGVLSAELGFAAALEQLRDAPAIGLQRLYDALPASRQVVGVVVAVRDQLHWLLLAIVLWLALDGWQPRLARQAR
jgi:hypothetical protein